MKKNCLLTLCLCVFISFGTFSQSKKEAKNEEPFQFQTSFHSLGFSLFNGINFAPKLQYPSGDIVPILYPAYVPEFTLHYNFTLKNGFGFALEVPFGLFRRQSLTKLSDYGASVDVPLEMGSFYVGFTGKFTLLKELHKNVCMQGELGFKFNPFCHPADQWDDYDFITSDSYYDGKPPINCPKIEQKYYSVPDATAAVLFFFHSQKKPKQNFVVGLHGNLSFVKRIKISYDTWYCEELDNTPHAGMGMYGWDSSAIGISIGYRFCGVK